MKNLTTNEGMELMVDIIENKKRHRDYDRTVWMADRMKKLITGEEMESLMRQFTRREDDDMFKQRCEITQHITSTVCGSLIDPEYKIPRSNGVKRILRYSNDNENQKLNAFEEILGKFWGDKSLDKYVGERWIDLTNLDPNSFIVYEWGGFDPKKEYAQPYPFEVSSSEAIYYQFNNNILEFLVVLNEFEKGAGSIVEKAEVGETKGHVKKRYTLYIVGKSVVFDELDLDRKPIGAKKVSIDDAKIDIKDGDVIEIKGRYYNVHVYDSKLNFLPVVRTGFKYDPITRGRTCIPPIWKAVPLLMKTVKSNSELDLTMSLSAHPQKIQYVRPCQNDKCNDGRLPGGKVCKNCGGTGLEDVATTAQEFIKLKMPRDKDEMIPLDDIIRYVTPPVDILTFQEEYIKTLTAQCKEAIYNSEIFSRQQIAETATGKNIDLQNVYDALYPMAEAFAHVWETSIYAIAKITDKYDGLIYSYLFSKDFKMKSMSELIIDLKTASDSKADAFVKQGIQDDIAQILYTDDRVAYARYKSKERFYPYSGKTREEVMSIVALAPADDFHRVLWEMYGWVFEELEREWAKKEINFYDLNYQKQWNAIKKKVEKKIEERKDSMVQPGIKEENDD